MRDRPSFTARRVASQRAQLERPSAPDGDPDAEQRLYRGLGSPLLFSRVDPGRMRRRTQWFDDATVDALARGVKQVVIVGAGYDGRALRFKGDGVRWIEVDHPITQQDKRRRVDELGVLAASGWTVERTDTADRTRIDGGSHGLLVLATPDPTVPVSRK